MSTVLAAVGRTGRLFTVIDLRTLVPLDVLEDLVLPSTERIVTTVRRSLSRPRGVDPITRR